MYEILFKINTLLYFNKDKLELRIMHNYTKDYF